MRFITATLMVALLAAASQVVAEDPAVYPPVIDINNFIGLHFFYYEPTTDVIMEMYLKSNTTLDYHVWLGTVNGAQCAKDQYVDLMPIGDGLIRIAYEEPTGVISSHILDTGVLGFFKMMYRVTMWPSWVLTANTTKQLKGCNQYDEPCLSKILSWRAEGPTEPQSLVAGAPLPVLFIEKVRGGNNALINCAHTLPSPFVTVISHFRQSALMAVAEVLRALKPVEEQPPIEGLWYRYRYFKAGSVLPGDAPAHESYDLYLRNLTFIEMKIKTPTGFLCSKVPAVLEPVRTGIWRITWRGNKGKNFQSNLIKPMKGWDVGQTFMGLTTPTVNPADSHAYPRVYSGGIQWAVIDQEYYAGANNGTAIGC